MHITLLLHGAAGSWDELLICGGALALFLLFFFFTSRRAFRKELSFESKAQPVRQRRWGHRVGIGAALVVLLLGAYVLYQSGVITPGPPVPEQAHMMADSITPRAPLFVERPTADIRATFKVMPEHLEVSLADGEGKPRSDIVTVDFEYGRLDSEQEAVRIKGDRVGEAVFAAAGNPASSSGLWLIRADLVQADGKMIRSEFPYYAQGSMDANDPAALDLLTRAQAEMNKLTSLRSYETLADGVVGGAATSFEFQAPDRLRYQVLSGIESIAIADKQYDRDSNGWSSRARVAPFVFPNFQLASEGMMAKMGRREILQGITTQVVVASMMHSADPMYHAFWIGISDHLIHQSAMATPGHYMIEYYSDHNAPARIEPPTPNTN